MKNKAWSVLAIAILTLSLVASACGGGKATTSTTKPPTTTTSNLPTTTTTVPPTTTTTTPPTTTTGGGTLSLIPVAITTHNAAQMASYKGLCQMCHGPGTTNSNPYPPSWDGKANGSTANLGKYTITPGSVQDHTSYTVDDCTKAGCHAAPGGTTTTPPPSSTTTTPPTSSTTTPPSSTTTTPTSTIVSGLGHILINTDGFLPSKITIKVNTVLDFQNNLEGTVSLICDALEIDTAIERTKFFTFTFKTAGTYTFTVDEPLPPLVITVVA